MVVVDDCRGLRRISLVLRRMMREVQMRLSWSEERVSCE